MAEFVTVASLTDVPEGTLKRVEVGDEEVALVNLAGTLYAISDVCSHRQESLSEGELEGEMVMCPRHGSMFNVRTGEVSGPPADAPVETFEVRVEGNDIQIVAPT